MRVVTLEEARNLPDPTPEELKRRRQLLDEMAAVGEAIVASRGGVPISMEEIEWALGDDEDYEDASWK